MIGLARHFRRYRTRSGPGSERAARLGWWIATRSCAQVERIIRSLSLTVLYRSHQATGFGDAANPRTRSDKERDRIAEKRRLIAFNRVPDKLKYPTNDEQEQRPTPFEEKQWPRDGNHRNADGMAELVQRVPMAGLVVVDERLIHSYLRIRQFIRGYDVRMPMVLSTRATNPPTHQ